MYFSLVTELTQQTTACWCQCLLALTLIVATSQATAHRRGDDTAQRCSVQATAKAGATRTRATEWLQCRGTAEPSTRPPAQSTETAAQWREPARATASAQAARR